MLKPESLTVVVPPWQTLKVTSSRQKELTSAWVGYMTTVNSQQEAADPHVECLAFAYQSVTKKGDLFPRGMLIHPDWKKDAVGHIGLMFATSLCNISPGEHPYNLSRLQEEHGAYRYMPMLCNGRAGRTGALTQDKLDKLTNLSDLAKLQLSRLIDVARSAPVDYSLLEKALTADFDALGMAPKDVLNKKLHWFRLLAVWVSEMEGLEGEEGARWRGNWEQLMHEAKDVFASVYSLRWRTTTLRGPAGLLNKPAQWDVPRTYLEKAGCAKLADEIILGEKWEHCLFGGMRESLVAYKSGGVDFGPNTVDVENFLKTLLFLGRTGLSLAAMMYDELPNQPLFLKSQQGSPKALRTEKFKEFSAKLNAYVREYEEYISKDQIIAQASQQVQTAYAMFNQHVTALREEAKVTNKAIQAMQLLIETWYGQATKDAQKAGCETGDASKQKSKQQANPPAKKQGKVAKGAPSSSDASYCNATSAGATHAVDPQVNDTPVHVADVLPLSEDDQNYLLGTSLTDVPSVFEHAGALKREEVILPSRRPVAEAILLLKRQRSPRLRLQYLETACQKSTEWKGNAEAAQAWLEQHRKR